MTRKKSEIIRDMREIVKPYIGNCLLKANYEGRGVTDKAEFIAEFDVILKLAQKAIQREECGDCIPRKAAIDINSYYHGYMGNGINQAIWVKLNAIPSVKPKAKTGKWMHDGSKWKNRYLCSECFYKLFDEPTNYCPNCGAEMEVQNG